MSDEKLDLFEELIWQNDPPENEDEEAAEGAPADGAVDEDDDLAPLGDGDIKPGVVDPG